MQQAKTDAPSPSDLVSKLMQYELLEDVPQEQLQWLVSQGEVCRYKPGEQLFRTGDPIDTLFIILEGKIQFKLEQNGEHRIINELIEGDISGALPYSRAKKAIAYAEARGKVAVLELKKTHFEEMVHNYPALTEALVHVMTSRVRDFTHNQQQTEKLAALGRLSAGLHHELNNPAAAALRASIDLKEHLKVSPEKVKELILLQLSAEQLEQMNELLFSTLQQKEPPKLSMMERSSLEEDIADWLEQQKLEDPYAMAETFAEAGFTIKSLDSILDIAGEKQATSVADWLYHMIATNKLVSEIQESTRRISALVSAVKSYSHMDRSPERERTDLEASIRNTLTVLNFKLKKKKIKVEVESPEELPNPCVYAGELNQVWTNLIDNAIDAMPDAGLLRIQLSEEQGNIKVSITDNGKGIAEDKLDKIFEPFFTTKSVGQGTGMGLDIAKKIIIQHGGSIEATSKEGETTFVVLLPENPIT